MKEQGALVSPIVVKELGGMSRRGRTYLLRLFYIAIAALIVASVAYPAIQQHRPISTSQYAALARRLFHHFTWLQMFFLPLASAVAASDMLHSEARRGTLSILLLTPLKPPGIVWGKWKAVLLHTAAIAFCGLPVLAMAVYLGGVGYEDLLWSLTLSLALSGVAAAMAISYSVRDRTVVEAAIRAFLVLQFSAIPYGLVAEMMGGTRGPGIPLMAWVHPYIAWWAAANPAESGEFARHGWIGAAAVSAWFVRYYLNSAIPPLLLTREGSKFLEGMGQGGPARHEDMHAVVAAPPLWERFPLLWKEMATRTVRLPAAARGLLFLLFAFLTLVGAINGPESMVVQLVLLCPILLFVLIAVGAGHFAREKERRGFEMLLSAPIHPGRVVGAKPVAGLLCPEVFVLAIAVLIGFVVLGWGRRSMAVGCSVGIFLAFTYALASALSLRSATYRTAFMGAASVVAFLLVGVPMISGLLESTPLGADPLFQFCIHVLHPLTGAFPDERMPANPQPVAARLGLYGFATVLLAVNTVFRFRRLAERQ